MLFILWRRYDNQILDSIMMVYFIGADVCTCQSIKQYRYDDNISTTIQGLIVQFLWNSLGMFGKHGRNNYQDCFVKKFTYSLPIECYIIGKWTHGAVSFYIETQIKLMMWVSQGRMKWPDSTDTVIWIQWMKDKTLKGFYLLTSLSLCFHAFLPPFDKTVTVAAKQQADAQGHQ